MTDKTTKILSLLSAYSIEGEDKEFLLHEMGLIEKRNGYKNSNIERCDNFKNTILNFMEPNEWYSATDIARGLKDGSSPQRVSAFLKQLEYAHLVQKCDYKRRSYFALSGAVFPYEEIEDTVCYQPCTKIENSSKGKFPWLAVAGLLLAFFFI